MGVLSSKCEQLLDYVYVENMNDSLKVCMPSQADCRLDGISDTKSYITSHAPVKNVIEVIKEQASYNKAYKDTMADRDALEKEKLELEKELLCARKKSRKYKRRTRRPERMRRWITRSITR